MTTEQLPDHWQLGCSNAKRWVNCPGSKYAVSDSEPGEMAAIGTVCHKIAELLLRGQPVTLTDDERAVYESLSEDEQAWVKLSVKRAVEFVQGVWEGLRNGENPEIQFEHKTKSDTIAEHGGTCDVVMSNINVLHVVDFKFGMVAVEAEDNEQLMCYLNLARQQFPDRRFFYGTIFQPAYQGDQTVKFSAEQLDEFLARAVRASEPDNILRNADPEWCQYCPLLATCDESGKRAVRSIDEFGTLPELINKAGNKPTEDDVERLERIVLMYKLAKDAYEKSSALLKQWHNDGATLKHHRVTSCNYRHWNPRQTHDVLERLPEDIRAEAVQTSIVSPKALQDMLGFKKKEFDDLFSDLLECTNRPTLKAGVKPSPRELALDLPFYDD